MYSIWYFEGKPVKNKKQLYNCGNSTAPLFYMLGTASFFFKGLLIGPVRPAECDWTQMIEIRNIVFCQSKPNS